jgi:hypothetical protein
MQSPKLPELERARLIADMIYASYCHNKVQGAWHPRNLLLGPADIHLASLALVESRLSKDLNRMRLLEGMRDKVPHQRQQKLLEQTRRVALLGREVEILMGRGLEAVEV